MFPQAPQLRLSCCNGTHVDASGPEGQLVMPIFTQTQAGTPSVTTQFAPRPQSRLHATGAPEVQLAVARRKEQPRR
jgi:hypothetical protein